MKFFIFLSKSSNLRNFSKKQNHIDIMSYRISNFSRSQRWLKKTTLYSIIYLLSALFFPFECRVSIIYNKFFKLSYILEKTTSTSKYIFTCGAFIFSIVKIYFH